MKKLLKSCSICFIIIVMISTTAFAAAPSDPVAPQSNSYILKTTVSPVALGNGVIGVYCGVTGTGTMDKIGISYIEFYKADGTYLEGHGYTESGYEYMMDYNSGKHNAGVLFQCSPGERYYAIVHFYASKGNGAGGVTMESFVVTAK